MTTPPTQIRVHHVALDRAWTDDGDFDHKVVKHPRFQARQHVHLRAAFDLEDTDRFTPAKHVIDRLLILRNRRQLIAFVFMMLNASTSSLSHSMKVRSSIAALPIGT